MTDTNSLKWLVACKVKPSKFEAAYIRVIAAFENPINAEAFIETLPEETKSRFFVICE